MLNRIRTFLRDVDIDELKNEFKVPRSGFEGFEYDPALETREFSIMRRNYESGEWIEDHYTESFEKEIGKKFYKVAKKDFDQIESELEGVTNPNVLYRKEKKLQSSLSIVSSMINRDFSAEKYPYLLKIFESFVDSIGEMTKLDVDSFKSFQEETRGKRKLQDKTSVPGSIHKDKIYEYYYHRRYENILGYNKPLSHKDAYEKTMDWLKNEQKLTDSEIKEVVNIDFESFVRNSNADNRHSLRDRIEAEYNRKKEAGK